MPNETSPVTEKEVASAPLPLCCRGWLAESSHVLRRRGREGRLTLAHGAKDDEHDDAVVPVAPRL